MEKAGRNDPCPCGSGKKFKKCCQNKMIGKKFMATKIDSANIPKKESSSLTNFFQQHVTPTPENLDDKSKSKEKKKDSPEDSSNLS